MTTRLNPITTPLAYSTLGITDEPGETPPAETPTAPVQRRKGTKQGIRPV